MTGSVARGGAAALLAIALLAGCAGGEKNGAAANEDREEAPAAEIVLDEAAPEPEPEPELEPEPEHSLDLSAPVTTTTTESGITITAPDGFLATEAYQRLEAEVFNLRNQGLTVSAVMLDLGTGNGIWCNSDERLYPASSIKAAYCAMVCENNGGSAGMGATMRDCLVNSSNDAYHTLLDTFGLRAFGDWLAAHGAEGASGDGYYYYYPEISASELCSVWQEIYRFGTSGEAGGSELAGYLAQTNYTPMGNLLRGSAGFEVWSKPGWYPADENDLTSTNDAGVVFSDCGPYVMVVMTDMSAYLDGLLPLIDALNMAHGTMCGGSEASLL